MRELQLEALDIFLRLCAAGLLGVVIGFERPSVSRTLQGFLSGIGFLGGAVIFKSGFDVKGIKAAAAIWITGALGLAIATSYWPLGLVAGLITAIILFVADSFPDEVREEKQEPESRKAATGKGP